MIAEERVQVSAAPPDLLDEVEQRLSTVLAAWSVASMAVGAALFVAGRATERPEISAFGRQTAAWGAVDGVIAAVGALARRRRGDMTVGQRAAKAKRLRAVLLANGMADVAYVAGGIVIATRNAPGGRTLGLQRGDGIAIVAQGTFLLVLDLVHARRLSVGQPAD